MENKTEGDLFIEQIKRNQKNRNRLIIVIILLLLMLIWKGYDVVTNHLLASYKSNKEEIAIAKVDDRQSLVDSILSFINSDINSSRTDNDERIRLRIAQQQVMALQDSLKKLKDALMKLDLSNGDVDAFEAQINDITKRLSELVRGDRYDKYITHGIQEYANLKESSFAQRISSKDSLIRKLLERIDSQSGIISRMNKEIASLRKANGSQVGGISIDSLLKTREDSLLALNFSMDSLRKEYELKLNDTKINTPIYATHDGVILYSDRVIRSDGKNEDTYHVKNRSTGFLGIFQNSIPLQINVSFDFKVNNKEQITVYVACEPPQGQEIPDTKTINIKGKQIQYIQPLVVVSGKETNLTVSFTLPSGFLYGKYILRLYSEESSEAFYHRNLNIVE